jgi:hypothetical protein
VWQAYVARFAIEHTFRFFKQTLKWTTPKLRAPAGGRLLDLVAAPGARAVAPGTRLGRGCALTLAAAVARRAAHARAHPTGLFAAPGAPGQSGTCAKTLWTVAGASQRQPLTARPALSSGQAHRLIRRNRPTQPTLANGDASVGALLLVNRRQPAPMLSYHLPPYRSSMVWFCTSVVSPRAGALSSWKM